MYALPQKSWWLTIIIVIALSISAMYFFCMPQHTRSRYVEKNGIKSNIAKNYGLIM